MSAGPSPLVTILQHLAIQAPFFLVYLIGIVVAVVQVRRHRKAATLALVALVVMLLTGLAAGTVQGYLIADLSGGRSVTATSTLLAVTGWVTALVRAAALGLLIAAVFVGRRPAGTDPDA